MSFCESRHGKEFFYKDQKICFNCCVKLNKAFCVDCKKVFDELDCFENLIIILSQWASIYKCFFCWTKIGRVSIASSITFSKTRFLNAGKELIPWDIQFDPIKTLLINTSKSEFAAALIKTRRDLFNAESFRINNSAYGWDPAPFYKIYNQAITFLLCLKKINAKKFLQKYLLLDIVLLI